MLYHTLVAPLWLLCITLGDVTVEQQRLNYLDERKRERESNPHLDRISHIRVLAAMACPPLHLPTFQASDAFGPTHLPRKPPAPAIQQHNVRLRQKRERADTREHGDQRAHARRPCKRRPRYVPNTYYARPLSLKRVLRMDTQARESAPSHDQAE
jgi:hypothetical protein